MSSNQIIDTSGLTQRTVQTLIDNFLSDIFIAFKFHTLLSSLFPFVNTYKKTIFSLNEINIVLLSLTTRLTTREVMSKSTLLSIGFIRHFSRFVTNDIDVKTSIHLTNLCRKYSTLSPTQVAEEVDHSLPTLPLVINRQLKDMDNLNPKVTPIREVWLENMSSEESVKLSIITLHPLIWGAFPRVDVIQNCHKWQTLYKHIDWKWMPTREELSGNNRKPWPQKGTGRARARGVRAPQWKNGGWCHGPRGPRTYFYMLPFHLRVRGLISMLSAKLAQNDLKVVDNLDIPSDKSSFIEELCEQRGWGPSVLFVDTSDIFARNISIATNDMNHVNLMPVYGLNVFSMLKHETLVLTLKAVEDIETKLLYQLKRTDLTDVMKSTKSSRVWFG